MSTFINIVKKFGLASFIAIVTSSFVQSASAASVSVFGMGAYSLYSATVLSIEIKGSYGGGGGLLIDLPISNMVALEVGGAYQVGSYTTAGVRSTTKSVHIPGGLQIGAGSTSILLGGYFDQSMETGGGHDYGALAGFRVRAGAMFVEPRFAYGLQKDVLDKNQMIAQVLLGYTFGGKK